MGGHGDPVKRKLFAFVMRLSDAVLPFSNSSAQEVLCYGRPRRMRTSPLCAVDTDLFRPSDAPRAQRAAHRLPRHFARGAVARGSNRLWRAAAYLPDVEFLVIGAFVDDSIDYLKRIAGPNAAVHRAALRLLNARKAFQGDARLRPSFGSRGFGVSLAEAMACECVPVVANRCAICQETVGETGILTPFNDPPALARGIAEALARPELGKNVVSACAQSLHADPPPAIT